MADTVHTRSAAPNALQLRVLTPQREILDAEVLSVTAQGTLGEFGVLPKHIPFLTPLEPGILEYELARGGRGRIAVRSGYAEVRDDVVTILADEAIPIEEIDTAAAKAAIPEAVAALEAAPYGHPDHETARQNLRWAEVRAGGRRGAGLES